MVESLKEFSEYIKEKPIEVVKYLLILLGLTASFSNLFDCIVEQSPPIDYILYVVVVFVGTLFLAIVPNNSYLCFILALFGFIAIAMTPIVTVSWGVVLILFSKRIAENILFSILIYIVTIIMVLALLIFNNMPTTDTMNILLAYVVIYLIDYLLYNNRGDKP